MEEKNNSYIIKKEKKSNKKKRKAFETQSNKNLIKGKNISIHSNKTNNIKAFHLDEVSLDRDAQSNNLKSLNSKYKKDLSEKFAEFLNKNKFKLSNNFDEKNAKKFLNKKDKCLERIIISDIIENENSKDNILDKNFKRRKTIANKKSFNKYFIVISNYDEEMKYRNTPKKRSVNMETIVKTIEAKVI